MNDGDSETIVEHTSIILFYIILSTSYYEDTYDDGSADVYATSGVPVRMKTDRNTILFVLGGLAAMVSVAWLVRRRL
jgi:hypothetical protein